ncbi:hypothetical protein TrVE_jg7275 [Triparma verrucosa]|uniref:Dynein light chain roadblock n=2 Tax=Triparma TaxID=722752 RepID=A0A9W7EUY0_9STRA|nr:hypothetical protein TrST_g5342 [Triparma strigata]GMH98899.1 hypothetical protein TrVE_jg7275 [Triparma verrucosa]
MSEVEETLERVKVQAGVEGYLIADQDGTVLRRFPSMSQELAEAYAEAMKHLSKKSRNVVRDLDPKNELKYLRIRAKKHEVLVAFDSEFLVIIIQRWNPAS